MRAALSVLPTLLAASIAWAVELPSSPRERVNDYAGLFSSADRARIEERLLAYERESSNQIVVAIFPSLEDEDLEDFTNRLFERWRLGQKQIHNGVLLAVFTKERKARIEVGYGLEARLTDALSRRILDRELAPRFRDRDYAGGVDAACAAIVQATRGEYRAPPSVPVWWRVLILLGVVIVVIVVIAVAILNSQLGGGTTYGPAGRRRVPRSGPLIGWGGRGGFGGSSGGGGGFSGGGGLSGGGGASGSW